MQESRLRYTAEELRALRPTKCPCVSRTTARRLKYFRLFLRHIPTITSSRSTPRFDGRRSGVPRHRCLVKVKFTSSGRPPSTVPRLPSLFLSNARCLRNKLDETALRLQQLSPDIAILCESWLSHDIPDSAVSISNYDVIRRDRDASGGGIIAYLSKNLHVLLITENCVPSIACCHTEILSFVVPEFSLLVISVYHPFWNHKQMHDEAILCIIDIIDFCMTHRLDPLKARVLVCGDFNDLRLYSDEICRLTSLTQIVRFPTRADKSLDLIFTNFSRSVPPCRVPPLGKSDHASIFWSPVNKSHVFVKKKVRKFTKSSVVAFHSFIDSVDWLSFVSQISDLNTAFATFTSSLYHVFDFFFPLKTVRLRPVDKPWVRSSLKILINSRDQAFNNGQTAKYLRLRKEVISHIKWLKSKYLKDISRTSDQRKTWKAIRSLSGGDIRSTDSSSPSSPEEFNRFFTSVFQPEEQQRVSPPALSNFSDCFSIFEVNYVLSTLKRKSCGPDGLPYWIFRNSSVTLSPVITYLFNWSVNVSCVPPCLKNAFVTPVPKTSRPTHVSDYRPISLLPILSKVLEKLVLKHLILPFVRRRLKSLQFAYVPGAGVGTSCSLTLLYDRVLNFLDTSGAVRVLSIDFSKAFDKILHSSILASAVHFDIPPSTVAWISSFLCDRYQRVRVGDELSTWSKISSGVPQGSVLGPILFCMVIDDFTCVCPNSFCVKYADDISILHFVRKPCEDNLQLEWDNVVRWSCHNRLPLNISKSCVMDIVTKKDFSLSRVTHAEGYLKDVSSVFILGVCFSSDLKWNLHFDSVVKKVSKRWYLIYNLVRAGSPPNLLIRAYFAYVRSLLLYSFPVFCNSPSYLLEKFKRVERRFVRIANVTPDQSILSAADAMCARLFKRIEANPSHPLRVMFSEREKTFRNCFTVKPPFARTKRYSSSFIKFARPS